MSEILRQLPMDLIRISSTRYNLDVNVVASMVLVESAGIAWATRYEPHTEKYVIKSKERARYLGITEETDRRLQMFSFGLMQVMGFKAVEQGYNDHLIKLCDAAIGLDIGCRCLRTYLNKYDNVYRHAILAYNAGSVRYHDGKIVNQSYLDKVNYFLKQIPGTGIHE